MAYGESHHVKKWHRSRADDAVNLRGYHFSKYFTPFMYVVYLPSLVYFLVAGRR